MTSQHADQAETAGNPKEKQTPVLSSTRPDTVMTVPAPRDDRSVPPSPKARERGKPKGFGARYAPLSGGQR